jgi:hypothetical protein
VFQRAGVFEPTDEVAHRRLEPQRGEQAGHAGDVPGQVFAAVLAKIEIGSRAGEAAQAAAGRIQRVAQQPGQTPDCRQLDTAQSVDNGDAALEHAGQSFSPALRAPAGNLMRINE